MQPVAEPQRPAEAPLAAIILTGAELLDGRLQDANGPYLSASLTAAGFAVGAVVTVPDDHATIVAHARHLLHEGARVLVFSGGLGTTHDDVTMAAVAEVAGVPLIEDSTAWAIVREQVLAMAARRHIDPGSLLDEARKQAQLPQGARPIPPAGLAPGALLELGEASFVVLPGPPHELRAMWPAALDDVARRWHPQPPATMVVRIYGVGEMQVSPILAAFTGRASLDVAITASAGEITVRAAARNEAGRQQARALRDALAAALPVYSSDGRTLDELLAEQLRASGSTVSAAESCTGGLLGGRITALPGSSDYFLGGVVSYADTVKRDVLGVPAELLRRYGAVSSEVAGAMAAGVRQLTHATYGLSVTGVAGPGGGTPAKPVGLVFFGCAGPTGVVTERQQIPGDREAVRRWSVNAALHLLRRALQEPS